MTMPAEPVTQGLGTEATSPAAEPTTTGTEEVQPIYAEQLAALPESVRPLVEPQFKAWDTQVNERFQKLHSQYEPWKEVFESYEPQVVNEALQLAAMLEQDPKGVMEALAAQFGEQGQQPPVVTPANVGIEPNVTDEEEDPYAERFGKLESALEQIAGVLVNQQNLTVQQQQQQALDGILTDITEKNPNIDQKYILNRLVLGDTPDEAVNNFNSTIEAAITARGFVPGATTTAPTVVSGSGGTPSLSDGGKKISELTNRETEDYVAKLLEQAAQA